jgi:hypothetical protein
MPPPLTIPITLSEHEAASITCLYDLYLALTLPNADEPEEVASILQRLTFLEDTMRELVDRVGEAPGEQQT